jgi:hypothetical protein
LAVPWGVHVVASIAGGGDVSFTEFYTWWNTSKSRADGPLHIDTSAGQGPVGFTIMRF